MAFTLPFGFGHQEADLLFGGGAAIHGAGDAAAAEDDDTIAQGQQHIEVFADIDDGNAFFLC